MPLYVAGDLLAIARTVLPLSLGKLLTLSMSFQWDGIHVSEQLNCIRSTVRANERG